jgi:outer membrane protein OmpA-like peptidoglycan-associated protein
MLICWWLHKRAQPEEGEATDESLDDTDGNGRQVIVGALRGGFVVLLLAAAFAMASRTELAVSLREPDCSALLQDLRILAEGQAYGRILEIVETQSPQPLGASCRRALREHKVRSLLGLADQLQGHERLQKLQQAREEAEGIPPHDLLQMIASRQQAEMQQQVIAEQQQMIVEQQHVLAEREARIRLLDERQIPIVETAQGVVMRLSDAALFGSGKVELAPTSVATLKDIAALLNLAEYKERRVRVEGHTDATGNEQLNQELSKARAVQVADVLAQAGVSKARLTVAGMSGLVRLAESLHLFQQPWAREKEHLYMIPDRT